MSNWWRCTIYLWTVLGWLGLASAGTGAQEGTPPAPDQPAAAPRITRLDTTAYPRIQLYLAASDPLTPLPATLPDWQLQEDGAPVPDASATLQPVGVDLIFVIDANESSVTVDPGSEQSRLDKVSRNIMRFATQFMDPTGLDQVSVIVPGADGGHRFLVQDATTPSQVVNAMVGYAPAVLEATPLQEMMAQAVTHAGQNQDPRGRFQAVMLYTDGARLAQQLAFDGLAAQAQAAQLPLFAAILGARADPEEIANVSRLTDPTGGAYLHLPEIESGDPFFGLWQQQGRQLVVTYQSPAPAAGRHAVAVTLGAGTVTGAYSVELQPPQVVVTLPVATLVRQGEDAAAPLADLTPASLSLPATVLWPDNRPRPLREAVLRVDGRVQARPELPPEPPAVLVLTWNLAAVDAGSYEVTVTVTDTLGLAATSPPVRLTVLVQRPSAPTPAPTPAPAVGAPVVAALRDALGDAQRAAAGATGWAPAAGGLLLLALLAGLWRRRRRRLPAAPPPAAQLPVDDGPAAAGPPPAEKAAMIAVLTWPDSGRPPTPLSRPNLTLGRDASVADIVLEAGGVSRLHARIKRHGDTFWLYDEGSAGGTLLDFERLGLAPRPLQDGSQIQIGRVQLRFRLLPAGALEQELGPASSTGGPEPDTGGPPAGGGDDGAAQEDSQ